MKRNYFKIAAMTLMLSGAGFAVSCGDEDPISPEQPNTEQPSDKDDEKEQPSDKDEENPGGQPGVGDPDTPGDNTNGNPLEESAQKERLSQIGKKLMNKVSTEQFNDIYDIMEAINDKVDDTNSDALEDWWEAAIDACTLEDIEKEEISGNTHTYIQRVHYLWAASNFNGEIELVNDTWVVRSNTNGLIMKMKDNRNQLVTLTITPSGNTTRLSYDEFNYEDYYSYGTGGYWDYTLQQWVYTGAIIYDETEINEVEVPEKVTIKLTRGSQTVAQATVTTNISVQNSDGEFSPENDSFHIITNTETCGYNIVSETKYENGKKTGASVRLVLNSEELVRFNMDANGRVRDDLEDSRGDDGSASISIMGGELILNGSISDISAWIDQWDIYDEEDESSARNAAMKLNNTTNIKLYFDNSTKASAELKFKVFKDDYYGYQGYYYTSWEVHPVVQFSDGSSYAVMEEYFSETYFDSIIKQFENLIEDFEEKYEDIE